MRFALESNRAVSGKVRIDDSFWSPKLKTFFEVTLKDTFDKLDRDGVRENYEDVIAGRTGTYHGAPWHNGLLMETVRGAADYLCRGETDEALVARLEAYALLVERAQQTTGGYLSTYTLIDRPHQRYGENGGDIRWQHDLYNNGCLIEAGVHLYRATGSLRLLQCALRCANELCDVIGPPPKKWIIPGHELPEYALLELYELVTDEPEIAARTPVAIRPEDYRALAHFWIHGRGHHENRTNHPQYLGEYAQDHAPINLQNKAVGHAVRAVLYYTGVTRLAMLESDEALLRQSLRLWNNVTEQKLHINGGVGATHFEEKFGDDYELPNTAYLETCASAGLILWAETLSRADGSARYFQIVERALYNLMLSSVTLQGDSYFYRNPLSSDGSDHHWAWHGCPCCPPMIHKIFGMMDKLIYAQTDDTLLVNLYVGGSAELTLGVNPVRLRTKTGLPWKGTYTLKVETAGQPFKVMLRVPEWAQDIAFFLNDRRTEPEAQNGYALFCVSEGDEITFKESLTPRRIEAHPYVREDRGRVALARGPLIYCLEGVDNHGQTDIVLAEDPEFTVEQRPDLLGGVDILHGSAADGERFTAVPLYAWDNRLAGKMNVWLRQKGKQDSWCTEGWKRQLYKVYRPKNDLP